MLYCLYTLVDITATGHHRSGEKLERNQQQNFDTVTQTIQLSGNMYYDSSPKKIPADIFGRPDISCWYFEWRMEIEELFSKDGDNIGRLKDSFEYVPFISGLTEQVVFDKPLFKLGQNIIFDFKQ
jgi:hypothetical protein